MVRGEIGDATPEKRAAFRTRLIEVSGRIADKSLAGEYRRALLDRFFASRSVAVRRWQRRPDGCPTLPTPAATPRRQHNHQHTRHQQTRAGRGF